MKLFVTGGAGFIGSNFARMALTGRLPGLEEAEITVFDALTYSGTLFSPPDKHFGRRYFLGSFPTVLTHRLVGNVR